MGAREQQASCVKPRQRRGIQSAAAVLAALCLGGIAAEADAEIIYRENFTNLTGANQPLTHAGWHFHRGSSATEHTVATDFPRIGVGVGEPLDQLRPSVNSNPASADAREGFVYLAENNSEGSRWPFLGWTEEFSIDRSLYSDLTFGTPTNMASSANSNQTTPDTVRMAIRIGSSWFVSGLR